MFQPFRRRKASGFTLIEVLMVILILSLLTALVLPGYVQARDTSRTRSCLANLTRIRDAKELYATECNLPTGYPVDWTSLVPYYLKGQPSCPAGGTYNPLPIGQGVDCSFDTHNLM